MALALSDLVKKIADGADGVEIVATVIVAAEHVYMVNVLGVRHIIRITRHIVRIVRTPRSVAPRDKRPSAEFHPETSAFMMTLYGDVGKDGKPIESVDDLTHL
jgi:hypothetical protein